MATLIEIYGKPIAKNRPRFYRRGDHVGTYSDQKVEENKYKMLLKTEIRQYKCFPKETPVFVFIDFMMPVPKAWPKFKIKQLEKGHVFWHIKKPDLDNLVKWVKDCGNKILWTDDSIVCGLNARKQYSLHHGTKIQIIDCEVK